jgi:hypothetical protein
VDHRSYGPVVRFRFRVGAWNNAALVDFARYNAFVGSCESTNIPPVIA